MSLPALTGAAADTNSPFSSVTGDAGAANPLTVPAWAVGMIVCGLGGSAGSGLEVALSSTKGTGTAQGRGEPHFYAFHPLAAAEAYHINSDDASNIEVYVTYVRYLK